MSAIHIPIVQAHDVSKQIPLRKKKFENVIKQLVHTSAVRSAIYEARGKFGIFRALQTSRVLNISMNER